MSLLEKRMPGVTSERTMTPRQLQLRDPVYWAGVLAGADCRDAGNSPVTEIRAGKAVGKVSASSKYGCSIIGKTSEALDGDETDLTLAVAVATELVRRQGTSGTFKLTGPPTASGTVRTATITYSAVNTTTGVVTITAPGTAEVQTLTLTDGTDGGGFRIKYGTAVSAWTAWNESAANVQTLLRALHADLAACTVDLTGAVYTITFPQKGATAGPKSLIEIVDDFTSDGGVYEGGITVARTATGVNGDFVTASLVQPTDGSETILGILAGTDGYPIKVVDEDGSNRDVSDPKIIVGATLCKAASDLLDYPADASLIAWMKAALQSAGKWSFSDSL